MKDHYIFKYNSKFGTIRSKIDIQVGDIIALFDPKVGEDFYYKVENKVDDYLTLSSVLINYVIQED